MPPWTRFASERISINSVSARRSTDKQEISLSKQQEWAAGAAAQHGVALDATSADLVHMQAGRLASYKDIRLDDGITGSDLNRPGPCAPSLGSEQLKDKQVIGALAESNEGIAPDRGEEKQTAGVGMVPSPAAVLGDRTPDRLNSGQPEGISITKVSRGERI